MLSIKALMAAIEGVLCVVRSQDVGCLPFPIRAGWRQLETEITIPAAASNGEDSHLPSIYLKELR
jgi:hypothetical protein